MSVSGAGTNAALVMKWPKISRTVLRTAVALDPPISAGDPGAGFDGETITDIVDVDEVFAVRIESFETSSAWSMFAGGSALQRLSAPRHIPPLLAMRERLRLNRNRSSRRRCSPPAHSAHD